MLPLPPSKTVPPRITAAIASISYPVPASGSAESNLPITTTPATAAKRPENAKTQSLYFFEFTPIRLSATSFAPKNKQ